MRFLILGSLEIRGEDGPVALGTQQQNALLAVLVLRANTLVAGDELVEALWGENAPPTASKIVQNHISKIRRLLADDPTGDGASRLETRGRGYVLHAEVDEVDARIFERIVEESSEALREGASERAAALARDALALWRGPPLADFQYDSFAQNEIGHLEEKRLLAQECRIEADLACGGHETVLGDLERLVRENPLREHLRELQMLALYRSGRQAEALDAFQQVRASLSELGLEPGQPLQAMQGAVLAQDPELGAPGRGWARMRRRRLGWRLYAGGGALMLAAGIAAAALMESDHGGSTGELQPLPASLCSPVKFEPGSRPSLLIVSAQPLRGPEAGLGNQVSAAIEFTLRENRFKAGSRAVAYQACDVATARGTDPDRCSASAATYSDNPSVIGIIGPLISTCAVTMIPVANRATGGPLAIVSPSNTMVGLTRSGFGSAAQEPGAYYPTGTRNYVRMMPADDFQSAANAIFASRHSAEHVFVLWQDSPTGGAHTARHFERVAKKVGIGVVGSARWRENAEDYRDVARLVARSGADAVYIPGAFYLGGDRLLADLRSALGPEFPVMASDGFAVPDLVEIAGTAAEGMTFSNSGVPPSEASGPRERRFTSRLAAALNETPHQFSVYAAAATQLLLDAIADSDGSRDSVVTELFSDRARHGVLGDFSVTPSGDTTATAVTIYRVRNGEARVAEVIDPPFNLLAGG